ncbi:TonB-dependent receptor [Aquisediminimonas sediminicola]|uniref:TonB-dependent receptor n=1 Tax=Alteraquisediminimonas sediminicola TaxID=2676787 RepID=UPI001C8DE966|nr:TonB-dependent receptor [Aquisediminimonas sediminicola]
MKKFDTFTYFLMATCAFPSALFAQDRQQSAPAEQVSAGEPTGAVGDIVVTANRRAESIQKVGASVMAFTSKQLESLRVDSVGELAGLTPNVSFKKQWGSKGNASLFYVRGIGQADFNEGSESPTTVYIDDFYILSSSAVDFQTDDIATAEVLRGPQGTLFGRNSSAGAVVMRTNQPTYELEGGAKVSVGSRDTTGMSGALNVPIVEDRLAIRFSATRETSGATTKNLYDGPGEGANDTHEGNFLAARAIVRWDPLDDLSVRYKYQYGLSKGRNGGDSSEPMLQIAGATIRKPDGTDGFGYNPSQAGQNSTTVISDGINDFRNKVQNHLLTISYDLTSRFNITSVTGYLKQFKFTLEECDGTPRTICAAYQTNNQKYWTQELRASLDLDKARLTFGGFYLNQKYANQWTLPIVSGTGTAQGHQTIQLGDTPGGLVQYTPNTSKVESYSFFGNVSYDVTDKLTVAAGLRWNHETRDFREVEGLYTHNYPDTGRYTFNGNTFGILALDADGMRDLIANHLTGVADPVGDPVVDYSDRFKTSFLNYQLSVDYKVTSDALLYASFKRGVKSGGFNNGLVNFSAFDLGAIPFKNEVNNAYELGAKWQSADRRIRINPGLFYYDYKNFQATAFTVINGTLGIQVINKDAIVYGAEIDTWANLASGLDLTLGAGYVHTKVKDVTNVGAGVAVTKNRELGSAPHIQSTGSLRYEAEVLNGKGTLSNQASFNYTGSRYVDVLNDPTTKLPSFINIDYNITYESTDAGWHVTLYAKNLTNNTKPLQKFNFASLYNTGQVNYAPPRVFGAEFGIKF